MQVGLVTLISVRKSPITSRPTKYRPLRFRVGPTLFLAGALHASLIFGLGFQNEKPGQSARTIEVTIAHQLSDKAPDEADFLAQANQEGSPS